MDKRQTAVDQLRDRLLKEFGFAYSDNIHDELKAMEKVQIIEAHMNAQPFNGTMFLNAQDYYNETYGQ
jgi:hypothetical protein